MQLVAILLCISVALLHGTSSERCLGAADGVQDTSESESQDAQSDDTPSGNEDDLARFYSALAHYNNDSAVLINRTSEPASQEAQGNDTSTSDKEALDQFYRAAMYWNNASFIETATALNNTRCHSSGIES
nr:expressed protein [Hymenolepis microstoma]CDS34188.2 expressed protein [Hymenolepis microstoma]